MFYSKKLISSYKFIFKIFFLKNVIRVIPDNELSVYCYIVKVTFYSDNLLKSILLHKNF
ncbi:hypothetical protein H1P_3680002 [Hyella patelloides LEGE 07179]|uniref:Uncharacterized protein n=1 Tax=Hyella patelloides LEGE 07179 TaxID=945734 RepID=A0A563VWG3_9CYAN|nr:hypothetical protein H1P_3680002 [Hyella patelloides LEGE 07179]